MFTRQIISEWNFMLLPINLYHYCQGEARKYSPRIFPRLKKKKKIKNPKVCMICKLNLNQAAAGSYRLILKSIWQKFTEARCREFTKPLELPQRLCPPSRKGQIIGDLFRGIWLVIPNVSKKQVLNGTCK